MLSCHNHKFRIWPAGSAADAWLRILLKYGMLEGKSDTRRESHCAGCRCTTRTGLLSCRSMFHLMVCCQLGDCRIACSSLTWTVNIGLQDRRRMLLVCSRQNTVDQGRACRWSWTGVHIPLCRGWQGDCSERDVCPLCVTHASTTATFMSIPHCADAFLWTLTYHCP